VWLCRSGSRFGMYLCRPLTSPLTNGALATGAGVPKRLRCAKPSDGLEPSTPPYHALPFATARNLRQRFSFDSAVFAPPRCATGCHSLQPRGSIKAPSFAVRRDNNVASRGAITRDLPRPGMCLTLVNQPIGSGFEITLITDRAGHPLRMMLRVRSLVVYTVWRLPTGWWRLRGTVSRAGPEAERDA
jgi:hypothetical protein